MTLLLVNFNLNNSKQLVFQMILLLTWKKKKLRV